VPIGMPGYCWKVWSPKTTYIFSTRKPSISLMSASEYLCGHQSVVSQNMYLVSQSLEIRILGCRFCLQSKYLLSGKCYKRFSVVISKHIFFAYILFLRVSQILRKKGKLVHFLFCGRLFLRFKSTRFIRIFFMAHNYEHNFYVFYFWRIKNGRQKWEN
jgi:hypothetical protein